MGNTTQQGGIRTDEATAIFDKTGIDVAERVRLIPCTVNAENSNLLLSTLVQASAPCGIILS